MVPNWLSSPVLYVEPMARRIPGTRRVRWCRRECGEVGILETAGGDGPRAMNEQTIKHAEAMLKDTENYPFIGDVIDQLKIGRTAFYRYFPTDRIKQLRNEHETNLQTG